MTAPRIINARDIDFSVEPYEWPFASDEAGRIETHWNALLRDRPALYNGRVFLSHSIESDGVTVRGKAFETDFSNFLAWRDFGFPDAYVCNCFSMAALRSADGAWLMGIMSDHTSNAGKIYFPAGTPDPGDVLEGKIDFAGSAIRELREETGLDASTLQVAPDWSVILYGPRVGCMKIINCHDDAKTICERVDDFLARDRQPELKGLYAVRTRADLKPVRMPDFIVHWLEAVLPE